VSIDPGGHYGLADVCLSIPCVVGSGGVECAVPPVLSDQEHAGMYASAAVLRDSLSGMTIGS
jgi:L-lactate dehydrogenase